MKSEEARKILEDKKYKDCALSNIYFNKIAMELERCDTTNEDIINTIRVLCDGLAQRDAMIKQYIY